MRESPCFHPKHTYTKDVTSDGRAAFVGKGVGNAERTAKEPTVDGGRSPIAEFYS